MSHKNTHDVHHTIRATWDEVEHGCNVGITKRKVRQLLRMTNCKRFSHVYCGFFIFPAVASELVTQDFS